MIPYNDLRLSTYSLYDDLENFTCSVGGCRLFTIITVPKVSGTSELKLVNVCSLSHQILPNMIGRAKIGDGVKGFPSVRELFSSQNFIHFSNKVHCTKTDYLLPRKVTIEHPLTLVPNITLIRKLGDFIFTSTRIKIDVSSPKVLGNS